MDNRFFPDQVYYNRIMYLSNNYTEVVTGWLFVIVRKILHLPPYFTLTQYGPILGHFGPFKGDVDSPKSRIWWNCDTFLKTLDLVQMSLIEGDRYSSFKFAEL